MANHFDDDRKQLDQPEPRRFGFRVLIAIGIVLVGVALAIWRHSG